MTREKSKRPVLARCPSNIALIKYWGKSDRTQQWPANDSLSMTLSQCYTDTTATLIEQAKPIIFYGGQQLFPSDPFAKKIFLHLERMAQHFGFRQGLRIETKNSFPASCGIASSASGMAALTLASLAAWSGSESFAQLAESGYTMEVLRYWARLGSGSACRSLDGGFVHWQRGNLASAQCVASIHPDSHWPLADIIVLVSGNIKRTSSSTGHDLAPSSPFYGPRLAGLAERIGKMRAAILAKNFDDFGTLLEAEAMEMHAIMATSSPALQYTNDDTWKLVQWLRGRRFESGLKAYFTIDAGPNLHVLCEQHQAANIASELALAFPKFELLVDKIGTGANLIVAPETNQ